MSVVRQERLPPVATTESGYTEAARGIQASARSTDGK